MSKRIAPDVDRAEWLATRRLGITSTDVASIVGVNPYKTALQVWWDKMTDHDEDLSEVEAVEWGLRLEEPVAAKFAHKHPEFIVDGSPGLITAEDGWRMTTPDRMLTGRDDGYRGVLEVKTGGPRQASRWEDDETPDEYVVQVQWHMAVTGTSYAWLGALIAGRQYIEREFVRDEPLIHMLTTQAQAFRNDHVLPKVPPIADPWKDAQLLNRIYAPKDDLEVELSGEAWLAVQHRDELKATAKLVKAELDECEATIKQELGDATLGTFEGKPVVTWRQGPRAGYTVAPTTTRTLRKVNRKEPSE